MYLLPSMSVIWQPSASLMNRGVPPTALNARTGELTPPGISLRALANAASELGIDRWVAAGAAGSEETGVVGWSRIGERNLMTRPRDRQRGLPRALRCWATLRAARVEQEFSPNPVTCGRNAD